MVAGNMYRVVALGGPGVDQGSMVLGFLYMVVANGNINGIIFIRRTRRMRHKTLRQNIIGKHLYIFYHLRQAKHKGRINFPLNNGHQKRTIEISSEISSKNIFDKKFLHKERIKT